MSTGETANTGEATGEEQTGQETGQEATGATETDATGAAGDEPGQEGSERQSGNAEAAKYRRQARDAQQERDSLRTQLDAMRTREVERLAADTLADGADVWHGGTNLASLVADDGTVSADAVKARADAIAGEKPHYKRRASTGELSQGPRGSGPAKSGPTFADIFKT